MPGRVHPFKVRINSGKFRGRYITFSGKNIRPTKATVRKTLFNWLRPTIHGTHCLDCFSGSGILAFEALSEGAQSVTCLDQDESVMRSIQQNCQQLSLDEITCLKHRYPLPIKDKQQYDIVFCDPPFGRVTRSQCIDWLVSSGCMKNGCLVYIEYSSSEHVIDWGPLSLLKSSRSAGVSFALLVFEHDKGDNICLK